MLPHRDELPVRFGLRCLTIRDLPLKLQQNSALWQSRCHPFFIRACCGAANKTPPASSWFVVNLKARALDRAAREAKPDMPAKVYPRRRMRLENAP
jgi:hypothetical protein